MTDIDIVAELRRKIGGRDGDDGVIGVTFGEMRSLLDAIDTLSWYADERNYNDFCPGHSVDCDDDGREFIEDNGERARFALAALERSDEG